MADKNIRKGSKTGVKIPFTNSTTYFEYAQSSRKGSKTGTKIPFSNPLKNAGGLAGGLEYLGASVLAGAGGVLEGTFDLIGGGIAALTGNKAYAEYLFENNVVGDWHKRIEDGYNPNGAIKFAGDVTTGLGQSATMLIPYVGVPLFFAGVGGQGVSGAVEKTGELGAKEWIYGGLSGAAEGALEYFVGQAGTALATVGKKAGKSITAKIASNVAKEWAASAAWKGVAKNMLTSASGEFVEEFLAEYIDTALLRMTGVDKEATTDLRQAAYAGLVGFASGLAMGGIASGIDSSRSYMTGRRVADAGNADVLIKTADKMITDAKVGKDSVVDNTIKQLRNSVEMYKKAENKGSDAALIYLGEVKSYMAAVETIHAVRSSAARLSTVNEAQATAYAKAMSYFDGNSEVSKNYTAQDWFNNKNDICTRYAAMGWAGAFLSDSRAEVETAAFNQAISDDMAGRAVGKPTVADIAGAEWDGSDATFYVGDANRGEGAPSEGDYLRIAKDAKGGYYMAVGNNAEGARGFAGRTENEVRELFNGYRDAVVEGRTKRAAEAEISARAAEARARADAMNAPESFATKSERRRAEKEAKELEGQIGTTEADTSAVDTLRDEINTGSGRIAENRYTEAQTDAARKAVKDFDMLDADTKAKILRWVESTEGKGVDADVVSAVASIMRIREGLQVIYADTKEVVAGFHDEIKKADRNLIVLSSRNDLDLLRETIAHELGHDVENAEGFEEIKKAAVKATKEADLKEWEELYKKKFPDMKPEEIENEVAMKALGRRLATPQFLNRYANKSTLRRLVDAGKQLIEYLRADEAGKLAIRETNKLIDMMDRAIMGVNVQGEGKGARYNITENDLATLRSFGRKSVNELADDPEFIRVAEKWARKFYSTDKLGTRSPFFRAWFGDWRAYDTTQKNFVEINTEKITPQDVSRAGAVNEDTGWKISVSNKGIDKTSQVNGKWSDAYHSLKNINSLLENAVLLDTTVVGDPSKKLGPDATFMHHLYCPVSIGGTKGIAKLYVAENRNDTKIFYLTKIEMASDDSRWNSISASHQFSSTDATISISEIFDFVKAHDKDFEKNSEHPVYFNPKPVSREVLNADGTPKVFYHGTNANFNEFKESPDGSLGKGVYFAESKEYARGFGKNVFEVYLRAENPYIAKLPGGIDKEKLIAQGFDGVYAPGPGFMVVYDPTQIKSATDNIGTFDRSNPDIRYNLTKSEAEKAAQDAAEVEAFRIYDITQKLRDTAHRVNDVERPVGNALENGIPTDSISQTTQKSTPSAKKTYNLTKSEAERAAQDAAEVEAFRNQQDDKAREDAEKALFDAEVIRTETIARDTNSTYFKWSDVNRDIKSLAKSYGIVGKEAREIAFAVHRAFNGFKAIQHRQEKRDNMIYSLVDLMIERADAAENKAGRWSDERRDQLYKRLNEIFDNNAKKTERQKARERVENAEELAWRAVNGSAIAPLLDRVKLRRFREKTKGVLSEDQWKELVKLAQRIRPKYSVNLDNAAEFLRAFYDFAAKFASEAVVLAEDPNSEAKRQLYNDARNGNEVLRYVDARLAGMLKDFSEREGGEWTDSDYETLRLALERLLALDGRFDKQFNTDGTFGETKDVADEVVSSLDRKYKGKVSSVNVGGFSGVFHTLVYNSLEPEAAVRLLEGARGRHILSRMVNSIKYAAEFAKNDERKWMREIEDFKTKNKEWWKSWNEGDVTLTFTLPTFGGKTKSSQTLLTKDEAASYYMTTKRLQAQAALALGRVEIADALDRKGEQYRSRVIDGLTDEQIDEILTMKQVERDAFLMQCVNSMKAARNELYKQFSDLDRQYIALIENFYATTSKTEKRNMDTRLYGSTNVFDGYYYPISRSSLNRDMDLSSTFHDLDDVSTRGYTFNKSTINGARSRLTIRGASEVTSRHARQLAMYKHLTMPLQNLQRMYNYRFNKKVAGAETVREYLNKYVWKGTEKYLSDYFKDVQGMSRRTANDAASQAFRHLQSGYVKFQLGANLKSLIKQFGSAVGMTSVVDLDVWAKGIYSAKIFSKEATADMKKYSKFAENRIDSNEVYYAANVSGKVGKVSDVLMKHLEWGDTRANLIMWAMAQQAVAKETNHAVGTVENKRLAGKKLDEFIMTVQDTSGAATKSAYARSPQVLVQGFTLFSSAPTKLASRLIVAATELRELRQLKNEGGISDTEMKKLEELEGKTKKVLGKVGGAVLMVALFEALVNIGWGKLGGDDEEDEKFVQTLATEVVSNAVGIIPLAGGFAESLISGYDVSNLYLDVYNDGIASIRNLYTMTANLASGEQVSQQTVLKNLRSVAYFSGQVTGIPIRNINNLITRTLGVVSDTAAYEYDALFYEPAYSADLKKAMEKGDEKLVGSIVGLTLRERTGAASSFASDELVRLTLAGHNAMPRAIPTTVNVDGEDRNVTRRERAAFEKIYSGADPMVIALMATEQYTELSDELRAKAVKVTYDIYHSRAKSEVFGAELSTMAALSYFEDYIDVPTLVAESAYIYGIKGTADAKRSEIVKAYISGYSPEAQAILLYAAGYRSEAVKEVISELYGRLDADAQKSLKNIFDF